VGQGIAEVVHVDLDLEALHAADGLFVVLVQRDLDVCFAEANLLEAPCGARVERAVGVPERPLFDSYFELLDDRGVGKREEAIHKEILRQVVCKGLLHVVERPADPQRNLVQGFGEI